MLAPESGAQAGVPAGKFVEYDLDASNALVPVQRPPGNNTANLVSGVIRNFTPRHPEGMQRVILLGDPGREMGSVAEPECRRIVAAIDLAEKLGAPLEWLEVCAGAKISMTSGTENMDWVSRVLRRLIEFTQRGGEVNVLVLGITVGAQPYWNAEATMLMHTRGILVMAPGSTMVLTGKQALEYSGSVSAADNEGIGGYDRIMGPNGQAQYQASSVADAIGILLRHYEHCYVAPGERFPRRAPTSDPRERDVRSHPHGPEGGAGFQTIGDIFSQELNPDRKKPFDIRKVMAAAIDQDHAPLERWRDLRGGDTAVVWDAHFGGWPVCLIGIQSRPLPRLEFVPADGPEFWSAGTLFPQSSKKIARAVNSASGNRPLVILANLSGFDGSPESMRRLQLEYGAEIGRAVVNFKGPIVFCVVSRYHGGAFVVFAKTLTGNIEIAALEGARASVIGGAPAAAVVFARDVETRTRKDARVVEAGKAVAGNKQGLADLIAAVRSEKLGEVGDEYDTVHSVERALKMESLDRIIAPRDLRPYLIDALERGMAKFIPGSTP
jgi:acetyl-CoA carboxylase carboxyltransferase component